MQGIADYDFIRPLGSGNHGHFFLARCPRRLPLDLEFVAVKVLHAESSDAAFRRATRELAAFAAVRSPHLLHAKGATYAQSADWGVAAAEGFIRLYGMSSTLWAEVNRKGGDV